MTSAFVLIRPGPGQSNLTPSCSPTTMLSDASFESEPEDEEIMLTLTSGSLSDNDSLDDSEPEGESPDDHTTCSRDQGIVDFGHTIPSVLLIRPRPSKASEHDITLEVSSLTTDHGGARGLPLCFDSDDSSLSLEEDSSEDCVDLESRTSSLTSEGGLSEWGTGDETQSDQQCIDDLSSVVFGVDLEAECSDTESLVEQLIGVVKDDPIVERSRCDRLKRVLSTKSLIYLSPEAGDESGDIPSKRLKVRDDLPPSLHLPSLVNGITLSSPSLSPRQKSRNLITTFSPIISTLSEDEEFELDGQLRDELCSPTLSRDNSPVPLLTPPQSPIPMEIDGSRMTVCEWPSNLVIDSALTNITGMRPLSPSTLDSPSDLEDPSIRMTPTLEGIEAS